MSGRVACVACFAARFVVLQPMLSVNRLFQPPTPLTRLELGAGRVVTDFGVHALHSLHG